MYDSQRSDAATPHTKNVDRVVLPWREREEVQTTSTLLRITSTGPGHLRLEGEVDISNVSELEAALEKAIGNSSNLLVDVRELSFIDCRGVTVIQAAALRLGEDGRALWLVSPSRIMKKVIRILGFDELDSFRIANNGRA